jgi:hypothetical protein
MTSGIDTEKETVTDLIKGRHLDYTLNDYWFAPSGKGPLAEAWKNKPIRLYYDLIAALIMAS